MKLSEISRYWAAKELTRIEFNAEARAVALKAPFACEEFTLELPFPDGQPLLGDRPLEKVASRLQLKPGTWCREAAKTLACFKLAKGGGMLSLKV